MAFSLIDQLKKRESLLNDSLFYLASALLIGVVFCYLLFSLKVYLQERRINYLENRIATYGTDQQRLYEKKFLDYKKRVNDFANIIKEHKISSNVFLFVEERTLSNVWFSNFDLSESINEIKLSGEAEDMGTLSKQVYVLEESEYVKSISVLNSQFTPNKKVRFILTLSLDPKIFNYTNNPSLLYR